jgi:putative transposase
MFLLWLIIGISIGYAWPRTRSERENLCLRQQVAVLRRRRKRPALKNRDRGFWMLMCRWFAGWRECLLIVQPATVLGWHRRGFRYYWRRVSRKCKVGRRRTPLGLRQLIRRMARENPLWGQVRIMGELLKLGYVVSPRTVRRYMHRPWNGAPSPRWRDFLAKHAKDIWACDFLTVRTLTFQTLYVFFVIHHANREIVHIRVTRGPTAAWTGQQLVNACFERDPPKYLLRDRDGIFGDEFSRRAKSLQIREIRTPVRSPKANSIAERFVGTLRRECLDYLFVFNERHLQQVVMEFAEYYNRHRPHRSLNQRPPCSAAQELTPRVTKPALSVVAQPVLGGLHHVYRKAA